MLDNYILLFTYLPEKQEANPVIHRLVEKDLYKPPAMLGIPHLPETNYCDADSVLIQALEMHTQYFTVF